ncbi:MAG: hypothetical protein JW834_00060 [Candidatus Diapherotrites archaeon]|nr:hypothetical protein [Candidatus Diapherotrites archaeon]
MPVSTIKRFIQAKLPATRVDVEALSHHYLDELLGNRSGMRIALFSFGGFTLKLAHDIEDAIGVERMHEPEMGGELRTSVVTTGLAEQFKRVDLSVFSYIVKKNKPLRFMPVLHFPTIHVNPSIDSAEKIIKHAAEKVGQMVFDEMKGTLQRTKDGFRFVADKL